MAPKIVHLLPLNNQKLVTDHDTFGYYADQYGLKTVGVVIPTVSTNAEPSAQELAELQEQIRVHFYLGATTVYRRERKVRREKQRFLCALCGLSGKFGHIKKPAP